MTKNSSTSVLVEEKARATARPAAPRVSPPPRGARYRGRPSPWNVRSVLFIVAVIGLMAVVVWGLNQLRGGSMKLQSSPAQLLDLH
ncbi:MAG: hypothetical protein JNN07_07040 [Verrucomicrobiales bacterium]|nr:hypothetical protein [Verrucomicrobiales bacterium]